MCLRHSFKFRTPTRYERIISLRKTVLLISEPRNFNLGIYNIGKELVIYEDSEATKTKALMAETWSLRAVYFKKGSFPEGSLLSLMTTLLVLNSHKASALLWAGF